jgi:hypothetical protein
VNDQEATELAELRELVASYRLLVPRLQEQTEAARREAAGMAPKPRPCDATSPSGVPCELTAGHPLPHRREGDSVVRSWGP